MGVKVREEEAVQRLVYAEERIWRTADDELVADGDPRAFELFAAPGQPIKRADAVRYGLVKPTNDDHVAVVEEQTAGDEELVGGTVAEVLTSVGDDPDRARAALEAERASDKPRKSLVDKLEAIMEG